MYVCVCVCVYIYTYTCILWRQIRWEKEEEKAQKTIYNLVVCVSIDNIISFL